MRLIFGIILMLSGVFTPLSAQIQNGLASVRPLAHEGVMTKSGERFSHDSLVASHRSIPFGSRVKITNLKNGQSVEVKINDRGPFIKGRIIDLSEIVADNIGLSHGDLAEVRLQVLKIETNFKPQLSSFNSTNSQIFGIQVGSYGEMDNANNFRDQLDTKHDISQKIVVRAENLNGEILYKVYIGQFSTRDEAEQYKNALPQDLQSGYVTAIK